MQRVLFAIGLFAVTVSATAEADTRLGNANATSTQLWSFTPADDGEVSVTISWTRSAATLLMVVVCEAPDDPEPLVMGTSAGGLDRYAHLQTGLIAGLPCLIGVSSIDSRSAYRLHTQHAVSEVTRGEGREPLDAKARALAWVTERHMDRVRMARSAR